MKSLIAVFLVAVSSNCEILFTDDFDDGDDDGWTHLGAAEYQVVSQEYLIYSQGERGQGISLNGDQGGVMSTPDYSVLCSITMETGMQAGIICRYVDTSHWYYRLSLRLGSSSLVLERRKESGSSLILDEDQVGLLLDREYLVRMQVEGDLIRGKIWTGSFIDEPLEWNVSTVDNIQGDAGSFGVFGSGYGKVSWSMIFDDVVVSTPVPDHLVPCTWAGIKAAGA